MQADPQGFVPHLHAYQDAINRGDADAAAALFLDAARNSSRDRMGRTCNGES
jgi:hypothetical protein